MCFSANEKYGNRARICMKPTFPFRKFAIKGPQMGKNLAYTGTDDQGSMETYRWTI